jgi:hypothetical protein
MLLQVVRNTLRPVHSGPLLERSRDGLVRALRMKKDNERVRSEGDARGAGDEAIDVILF